jgi:hypothetical protein
LAAVNAAQEKRRQAAADLLEAENDFYDPNKKRLTDAKIKRIDAAFKAAQENDTKRAEAVGTALAVSKGATAVYETEQARLGIARAPELDESKGDDESVEVFVDASPVKKVKTPKKSLDAAFIVVEAKKKPTKSEKKAAKATAKYEALIAKAAAKAEAKDARVEAKAAPAKDARVEAATSALGLLALQKRAKAQTAAREKGRERYFDVAGLPAPLSPGRRAVPPAPPGFPPGDPRGAPLMGLGRFLGRFA